MSLLKSLLLLGALTLASSCASVFTGTREIITVDSTPNAAEVSLKCGTTSVGSALTPATFTILRNAGDCVATVSKSGYLAETVSIEQGINPVYWLNFITAPVAYAGAVEKGPGARVGRVILVAAAVPFFFDIWTGAIHKHRGKNVQVTLRRNESD